MFDDLVKENSDHLVAVENLLEQNRTLEAEKLIEKTYLSIAKISAHVKKNSSLLCQDPSSLKQYILLKEKFTETAVKFNFSYSYHLIDCCQEAIESNNFEKAGLLHQKIQQQLSLMASDYRRSSQKGNGQTAAYIDFPKDFHYLTQCFNQLNNSYNESIESFNTQKALDQACKNFANACNFVETQRVFGLDRPKRGGLFSPLNHSVEENSRLEEETCAEAKFL